MHQFVYLICVGVGCNRRRKIKSSRERVSNITRVVKTSNRSFSSFKSREPQQNGTKV